MGNVIEYVKTCGVGRYRDAEASADKPEPITHSKKPYPSSRVDTLAEVDPERLPTIFETPSANAGVQTSTKPTPYLLDAGAGTSARVDQETATRDASTEAAKSRLDSSMGMSMKKSIHGGEVDKLKEENDQLRERIEILEIQDEYLKMDAIETHYRNINEGVGANVSPTPKANPEEKQRNSNSQSPKRNSPTHVLTAELSPKSTRPSLK